MSQWDLYAAHRKGLLSILGCPGLIPDHARPVVERWHEEDVFAKHGIIGDLPLMGRDWCIRYVNARRAVERELNTALTTARKKHAPCTWWDPIELPASRR